jgi:hypothetical protein
MSEAGERRRITSQVFDEEKRREVYRSLKGLVSRFLKGKQDDLNVKFDNYLKVTRDEFNELLGDYEIGGYDYTNKMVNGMIVYEGTYTYNAGEKEVASNKYIITSKLIRITFHKEKDNGTTLYVIHQIKGFTWGAGIKIEHYDEYE